MDSLTLKARALGLALLTAIALLTSGAETKADEPVLTGLEDLSQEIEEILCSDERFLVRLDIDSSYCKDAAQRASEKCLLLASPFVPQMPEKKDREGDAEYVDLFQKIGLLYGKCLRSEVTMEAAYSAEPRSERRDR